MAKIHDDIYYMKLALKEAETALKEEEVPIGCVIVNEEGKVIAKAHNKKEQKNDPSAHAEILAIQKACKKRKDRRLNGCTLYVTVEPCLMCASCIDQARVSRVVFGLREDNSGAYGSKYDVLEINRPNFLVVKDVLQDESKALLQGFFKNRRK